MRVTVRMDQAEDRMRRIEMRLDEAFARLREVEREHNELRLWVANAARGPAASAWKPHCLPADSVDLFRKRLDKLADSIWRIEQKLLPPPKVYEPHSSTRSTLDPRVNAGIKRDAMHRDTQAEDKAS